MQKTTRPPIPQLANTLVGAMPPLQRDERRLALALYRRLARAEPVDVAALSDDLGRDEAEVRDVLVRWPGVFRDDDDRVVSFWGLAIPEMPHRFQVEGRQLYTWCAWDALFIPELIGSAAEVESRPPRGGGTVRLVVYPDGVREVVPETTVVSMVSPTEAFDYRVIMGFCSFVHFFPSPDAGAQWVAEHPGTFPLSVTEAHELGRIVNAKRFGAGLESSLEATLDS